jgi:histidine triad (HIT) family protein
MFSLCFVMKALSMPQLEENCLFCKLIRGELPVNKVLENERLLAFYDLQPQAPVHVLIISKTHTPTHAETQEPQLFADLMQGAQQVAQQLGLSAYRLVMNNGAEAGQSVFHMHLHLLAGRAFTWPPG